MLIKEVNQAVHATMLLICAYIRRIDTEGPVITSSDQAGFLHSSHAIVDLARLDKKSCSDIEGGFFGVISADERTSMPLPWLHWSKNKLKPPPTRRRPRI